MAPKLGKLPDETQLFLYSVKVVCGRQPEGGCCCVAGSRPGVCATEVSIHNFNATPAGLRKEVLPLVNSGAVVWQRAGRRERARDRPDRVAAGKARPWTTAAGSPSCCSRHEAAGW